MRQLTCRLTTKNKAVASFKGIKTAKCMVLLVNGQTSGNPDKSMKLAKLQEIANSAKASIPMSSERGAIELGAIVVSAKACNGFQLTLKGLILPCVTSFKCALLEFGTNWIYRQ